MASDLGANLMNLEPGLSSRRNSFTEIVNKMHMSFNNLTQNDTIEVPVATLVENKDGLGGATYDLTYRKVTVKGYTIFSSTFCPLFSKLTLYFNLLYPSTKTKLKYCHVTQTMGCETTDPTVDKWRLQLLGTLFERHLRVNL